SRIGPGRVSSMQHATASARRAPLGLAAAMRRGFCNQRAKKTPASACIQSPVSVGFGIYSNLCMLQFWETPNVAVSILQIRISNHGIAKSGCREEPVVRDGPCRAPV